MIQPEHLNTVSKENRTAILTNHISSFMIQNQMTLKDLESAVELVKNLYKENATIKKPDKKELKENDQI